jgi:hypothetical protein
VEDWRGRMPIPHEPRYCSEAGSERVDLFGPQREPSRPLVSAKLYEM